MPKLTAAERASAKRRRIYAYVKNTYGSSAIAKAASGLSYEELYNRYGIELNPRSYYIPEKKHFTKTQRARRIGYYENYKQAINEGYAPDEAIKTRQRKPKPKERGGGIGVRSTAWYELDFNVLDERGRPINRRSDQWRIWSRYANYKKDDPRYNKIPFPQDLVNVASRFNRAAGLDANAKYGYSRMWLVWVGKYTEEEAAGILEVRKSAINGYAYIEDYKKVM